MSEKPSSNEPQDGPNIPLGFMLAGSEMVSFTVVGLLIDSAAGTMPGFTIGLTLLGLVAAFLHLKQMAKSLTNKKPKPPGNSTGSSSGSGSET